MTRPLRIGLIGAGGIATMHRDGYVAAGAHVVALSDVHAPTLAARAAQWGVARTYLDYHEMLAVGDVDAVSICAPTAVHHPATLACAAAGVHVLCEKPIALDLAQADEMIAACERAGVVLMVNHQLRSHGAARLAQTMLARGELGDVSHVRLRQAHDWGGATSVGASFATRAIAGGGTLLDNGCHLFDFARFVAGDVAEVFARVAHRKFPVEVEDTAHVSLGFASGAIGTVEVAWTATGWDEGWSIYGSEGALEYGNRTGVPILRHYHRSSPGTPWGETDVAEHRFAGAIPHVRHVMRFVAAVRGLEEVACTGQDGREAVRLVLASYASAEAGRAVAVTGS
jgi:predicted dehydrogenase